MYNNKITSDKSVEQNFQKYGHKHMQEAHFDKSNKKDGNYWGRKRDLLELLLRDKHVMSEALHTLLMAEIETTKSDILSVTSKNLGKDE